MKKWSMFLAAAACACVLASPLQAAEHKKVNTSFPTAATTGALYPLGAGIANVWNTKLGYVNARVQASNGGIQNLNLLKAGNAQVSFAVSSITYEALNGERGFKDRAYKDVRVLAGLYYNPNQVVARTDSGVASLADFKGKSFAPGAAGGTTEVESRIHFTETGLKYPDDIKAHFVGFTESIDLMRNKQLDGVWIMAGMPTATVTEMCSTANGKLVGMDDELISMAYERTCLNTGGLNWAYMNKILQRWQQQGFHSAEDVRTGDRKTGVPKGASGQLGEAELEAIQKVLQEG